MSNAVIAFFIGAGFAGWLYAKLMRSTGGNTRDSLLVAGIAGVVVFALSWFLAATFLP